MSVQDAAASPRETVAPRPAELSASAPIALLAGFALLALTNAIAIPFVVPWPKGGLLVRLAHHALDLSETLGLGMLVALAVEVWRRFVRVPRWASLVAYTAVSTCFVY